MSTKSSRAVLRAVVLPALGLTSADLLLAACDRGGQPSTIEQSSRQIAAPGMISTETPPQPSGATDSGVMEQDAGALEAREIPVPGTVQPTPREPTEDPRFVRPAPGPPAPRPPSDDIVRPPPGPPPIRTPRPGSSVRRPRPGPPTGPVGDLFKEKAADLEGKPEARTERRGRTPTDDGSLPGIAGARARRAAR